MTGLELLKSPGTTAEQIADIVAEQCPPVALPECDGLSCRGCWISWLTTGEPPKAAGPSDKQTAPYRAWDKANERKSQVLHQGQSTRDLRSLVEAWQRTHKAPYSALRICFNAILAAEEKRTRSTPRSAHLPPRQEE